MKVLGLDSAGRGCAVAVLDGEGVLARRVETMVRGQSERLMPLIAETLATAGLVPAALDLIAVTTGPGSFTGIRIGLAAARGLALATGRPAIGVGVFDAYAAAAAPTTRGGRTLVVAVDSRREEFYLRAFMPNARTPAAQVLPRDIAAWLPPGPLVLAGDAADRLQAVLGTRETSIAAGTASIDPVHVAQLGSLDYTAGRREPPRPFYLRAPDTTTPRRAAP